MTTVLIPTVAVAWLLPLLAALLSAVMVAGDGAVWWVDGSIGTNANGCGDSALNPCATIQAAVSAASDGDTISVQPIVAPYPCEFSGLVPDGGSGIFVNKSLTFRAAAAASGSVTIDCYGSGRAFVFIDVGVVMSGFTIQNGFAPADATIVVNLTTAVSNQRIEFTKMKFFNNTGGFAVTNLVARGGAGAVSIYIGPTTGANRNNSITFDDVLWRNNRGGSNNGAAGDGAGAGALSIYFSADANEFNAIAVRNNTFIGNSGGSDNIAGGGAGAFSLYYYTYVNTRNELSLSNSVFIDNSGGLRNVGGYGAGAISISYSAAALAVDHHALSGLLCVNNSGACGAMVVGGGGGGDRGGASSDTIIANAQFTANRATCATCIGGAVCLSRIDFMLRSCAFDRNTAVYAGGSLFLDVGSNGTIARCQFTENRVLGSPYDNEIHSQTSDHSLAITASTFELLPPPDVLRSSFALALNLPVDARGRLTNGTRLHCPSGFVVFVTDRLYGCQYCGTGTYNIGGGTMTDANQPTPCTECPYGAVCAGGDDVRALAGYWTEQQTSNVVVRTSGISGAGTGVTNRVIGNLTACSPGFCCPNANACPWNSTCSGHRTGSLCGECEVGYSQTYGSTVCVPNSECNDGAWAVIVFFMIGACVALWFFYDDVLTEENDGLVSVVVYFYQMVPLFFINVSASDTVVVVVSNIFDFRFIVPGTTQTAGICPFPGLTTLQYQILEFFTWIVIAIPLAIICLMHWNGWSCDHKIAARYRNCKSRIFGKCCAVTHATSGRLTRDADEPAEMTTFAPSSISDPALTQATAAAARSTSVVRGSVLPAELPLRARIYVACLRMALYTFSAVVKALFTLLQCVPIGAGAGAVASASTTLYLLVSPSVVCYQDWQIGLFFVLAVVLASPLVLAVFTYFKLKEIKTLPLATRAVMTLLVDPFRADVIYWESVRLVWRLCLILAFTFSVDAVTKLVSLVVVSVLMLFLHVQFRPFRDPYAQQLGTLTLLILVIVGCLNLPSATAVQNASLVSSKLDSTLRGLQVFETVLLLLPGVLAVIISQGRKVPALCGCASEPEGMASGPSGIDIAAAGSTAVAATCENARCRCRCHSTVDAALRHQSVFQRSAKQTDPTALVVATPVSSPTPAAIYEPVPSRAAMMNNATPTTPTATAATLPPIPVAVAVSMERGGREPTDDESELNGSMAGLARAASRASLYQNGL